MPELCRYPDANNKGKVEIKGVAFEKDQDDNDNVKVTAPSGKVIKFANPPKIGEGTEEETKIPSKLTQNEKLPLIKDNYNSGVYKNLEESDMGRDIIFIGTSSLTKSIRLPPKTNLQNGSYIKIVIIYEGTGRGARAKILPGETGTKFNKTQSNYLMTSTR